MAPYSVKWKGCGFIHLVLEFCHYPPSPFFYFTDTNTHFSARYPLEGIFENRIHCYSMYVGLMIHITQRFHWNWYLYFRCWCFLWLTYISSKYILIGVSFFSVCFLGVARFVGAHAHHHILCYFLISAATHMRPRAHTHSNNESHDPQFCWFVSVRKLNIFRICNNHTAHTIILRERYQFE